MAKKTETQ